MDERVSGHLAVHEIKVNGVGGIALKAVAADVRLGVLYVQGVIRTGGAHDGIGDLRRRFKEGEHGPAKDAALVRARPAIEPGMAKYALPAGPYDHQRTPGLPGIEAYERDRRIGRAFRHHRPVGNEGNALGQGERGAGGDREPHAQGHDERFGEWMEAGGEGNLFSAGLQERRVRHGELINARDRGRPIGEARLIREKSARGGLVRTGDDISQFDNHCGGSGIRGRRRHELAAGQDEEAVRGGGDVGASEAELRWLGLCDEVTPEHRRQVFSHEGGIAGARPLPDEGV